MTWSLLHSMPLTSASELNDVFEYLFDTALAGRACFTVGAHPDGSAFKRKYTITLPNPNLGGANDSRHYWVNWQNTTPTRLYVYGDATYTTVPGDLCTYTTYDTVIDSWDLNNGSARFWVSDEAANALLVTQGKRLLCYWPGWDEWALPTRGADTWDGTKGPAGMMWPMLAGIGSYYMAIYGNYRYDNSSTTSYLNPVWGYTYGDMKVAYPDPSIFKNFGWMFNSTNASPGSYSFVIAGGTGNDVAGYFQGSTFSGNSNINYIGNKNEMGQVVLDTNSNEYWFITLPGTSYRNLAFNMGTSEPVMT